MTWLTWRQLRGETLAVAVLLAVIAVFAVVTGIEMRGFEGGLARLGPNAAPSCGGQGDFERSFGWLLSIVGWFNIFPLFLGVFIGAPLVAREVERGTHRLAWTQSITRTRWLMFKLGGVAVLAVAFGVVVAGVMTWWRQPFDIIDSPFSTAGFDVEGVTPSVHALFALAVGVAAGTLIRRTIPAMAVTLVGFLAARLPIEFLLRPHYMAPLRMVALSNAQPPVGAWVLDQGFIDGHGNPVFEQQVFQTCAPAVGPVVQKNVDMCIQAHGWVQAITYQPADRFWPFQFIEAGIFLALSAVLLTVTVLWIRHRLR